uniref:Uncharacterized protein n=1 Tax=Anguilla anguilla TaxID=7936 RepID=A0A0E9XED8_ANGAN
MYAYINDKGIWGNRQINAEMPIYVRFYLSMFVYINLELSCIYSFFLGVTYYF